MSDSPSTQPPPPKPKSRLRRIGRKLLALFISTLIALLLAEFVIRWVAPQIMVVPMTEGFRGLQVLKPNVDGRGYVPKLYDVTYRTNSQRFRGKLEYATDPKPETVRIIATGDSLCFGIGVNDDQAFPALLEKSLQSAHQKVEVINAGISGTGTGAQALWYETYLSQFKSKILIVTVFANDIDDDLASPYFTLNDLGRATPLPPVQLEQRVAQLERARKRVNAIPGYSFLAEHSHLMNLIRRIASDSMTGGNTKDKSIEQLQKDHDRFIAQGLPLFDAELHWLNEITQRNNCKLVLAYFPCRESIYNDPGQHAEDFRWQSEKITAALQTFAARENVPFLNTTQAFKQKSAESKDELYYKGADWHPNPQGYQLFAEELSIFLRKSGLLPTAKN